MPALLLIRAFALILAVLYGLYFAPWDKIQMFLIPGRSVIYESGTSQLLTAGEVGLYASSVASVGLAFFAIPRWRRGVQALGWCYVIMWLSLLTRLETMFWIRDDRFIQITDCIHSLLFPCRL